MMKKLFSLLLATVFICLTCLSAHAVEGDVIYSEDFDNIQNFADTGWTIPENALTVSTAKYSIEDGRLIIDNLDASVGKSADSFAIIVPDAIMSAYADKTYSYQYEMTYLAAENSERYASVLVNYNGASGYAMQTFKVCGYGTNQVRRADNKAWVTLDKPGSNLSMTVLSDTETDKTLLSKLYNETLDRSAYALINRTFTVRVEVTPTAGCTVYINNVKVSESVQNLDYWTMSGVHNLGFKTSVKVKLALDNLIVWEGAGEAPNLNATPDTTTKPDTTVAPDTTDATETTAPEQSGETGDAAWVYIVIAMISIFGMTLISKRKER